jgi:two-component system cell cycle response regulator DivK
MAKRILVVEDQADNMQILRDLLTSAGYELIEAKDGEEGVKVATAEGPDLILMDIQLPLLDGYEATRRIKADPALRAIPIIVVTSYALSGDEAKAREALARAEEARKNATSELQIAKVEAEASALAAQLAAIRKIRGK